MHKKLSRILTMLIHGYKALFLSFIVFYGYLFSSFSLAQDTIYLNRNLLDIDKRLQYLYSVLDKSLAMSADKYGDYQIHMAKDFLPKHRLIDALAEGDIINVAMVVTSPEREQKSIPIRIPLRLGALALRLLVIHQDQQKEFANITTLDELRALTVGLDRSWVTWDIFDSLDFKVASVSTYNALFEMLSKKRFDFIPRGIHEAYHELEERKLTLPHLMVVPNIMLCIPAPTYMFVSPKYPRIAERLSYGLEKMVATGELKRMFYQFYDPYLRLANIKNRTMIKVDNDFLPKTTPYHRKELWLDEISDCR